MNPDFTQVTRILLATGGWTDITAGSYHEGEWTGHTAPTVFWATAATGSKTIWGPRSSILAIQIG